VADPVALTITGAGGQTTRIVPPELTGATLDYSYRPPGALNPQSGQRKFRGACVVAKLVYGLVNVRTDGETILTATMNEGDQSWSLKSFTSRF
jgi:hypothetical protein